MLLTIISVLLILSFLVVIHELGHFFTALKFGMKVEEFAVGMGPALFKYTSKKTNILYSIRAFPIGGFCRIKGEDGDSKDSDSFGSKKPWQRAIVLIGGVFMNFVFAILFIYFGFLIGTPTIIKETGDYPNAKIINPQNQIISVLKDSQAEKSGIKPGYELLKINDQEFTKISDINNFLAINTEVKLLVKAENEVEKEILIKKEFNESVNKEIFGLSFHRIAIIKYSIIAAIPETFKTIFSFIDQMFEALGMLLASIFTGKGVPDGLAGPVGIAVITGEVVRLGISYILQFIAVLSLNLAVINILPFPALDGGRLIFLFFEKIKGKPLDEKFETIANGLGFLLLMALIVFVTFKDIGTFILHK